MKISALPLLDPSLMDGTETLPIVKGLDSYRSTPGNVVDAAFGPLASALAVALGNYRPTRAQGATDFAVGAMFTSDETGLLSIYRRIAAAPGYQFYSSVPTDAMMALKANVADLAAQTGAGTLGTAQGRTVQAALDSVTGGAVVSSLSRVIAATLAVGAGQQSSGGWATVTSSAGYLATMTGTGGVLRDVSLLPSAPAAGAQVLGVYAGNLTNTTWSNVAVDMTGASAGTGLEAFMLYNNVSNHFSFGLRANGPGYGYLYNNAYPNTGVVVDGHVMMGFNLKSGADAIEYNAPGAAFQNVVTWGGLLHAGVGGTGTASGFSLGKAHNQGWVAGGFVSKFSRNEAVHIEDGSSFGVLSSFVMRACQTYGIWMAKHGNNVAQATPIVTVGFAAEGPGKTVTGSAGVYHVYAPDGYNDRFPTVAGYISGFETGLWLDGLGVIPVSDVTVDNCTVVLKTARGRHYGRIYSNSSTTLLQVAGGGLARADAFVQSDSAPTNNISFLGAATGVGAWVKDFAYPALGSGTSLPASSYTDVPLFQAPVLMRGQLTIIIEGHNFWEGRVECLDGKVVGAYEMMSKGYSVVAVGGADVPATFTGTIAGNTLTTTSVTGAIGGGTNLVGAAAGTRLLRQLSGTAGGAGNYLIDVQQNVTSATAMSLRSYFSIVNGVLCVSLYNAHATFAYSPTIRVEFKGTFYRDA